MMLEAGSLPDQYNHLHLPESVWSLDVLGLSVRATQVAVYNSMDEMDKRAKMQTILAHQVVIKPGGRLTDEDVYIGQGKRNTSGSTGSVELVDRNGRTI
jgi:hypothetical protein